jgi:hypothetical protein
VPLFFIHVYFAIVFESFLFVFVFLGSSFFYPSTFFTMVRFADYFADKYDKVVFRPPASNKKGYPTVNFFYGDDAMKFQLTRASEPKCFAPFGVSVYIEKGKSDEEIKIIRESARKNLDIGFSNKELVAFFEQHDEFIIQSALKNRESWFAADKKGNYPSEEQIRSKYTSSLTVDPQYGPRLRTKVNCYGKLQANVTKISKHGKENLTPDDLLDTPFKLIVILDGGSIWFNPKAFGTTFNSTDILVFDDDEDDANKFDYPEEKTAASSKPHSEISEPSELSSVIIADVPLPVREARVSVPKSPPTYASSAQGRCDDVVESILLDDFDNDSQSAKRQKM